MHYLNHTFISLPSYGDKTLTQLTISASLELPILKGTMLTPLTCFISLNIKIEGKVKIENCFFHKQIY